MTGKRPTAISYYWFVSSPYGYEDEDMECMLDTISDLWSQDFEVDGKTSEEQNEAKKDVEKDEINPPQWSSRSSPSGTFVRVNATMVNSIDR
eukprot:CAMPEP_0203715864 /NCGR_PEP_ID=MMETSP0092-20131115/617_1 /ASSEMBLY_ACC=CAM_ASM_001090 /TAXON_ID=426623 /ORGANISM="Chaetoceros affinis, Strain CCMP159" /LENGTH=91 /DNA_ID=CAMNT_0050594197 /DNA_START=347 /DNA_END=622 /DNA_ORIENTATION=+